MRRILPPPVLLEKSCIRPWLLVSLSKPAEKIENIYRENMNLKKNINLRWRIIDLIYYTLRSLAD